jgi:hypothetical protein
VFLVAASTSLVLAPAASAGVLGLKVTVSPHPGRTAAAPAAGVAAVGVDVATPVVEAHLQVSTAGVSAAASTPQAAVKASIQRQQRVQAARTKPALSTQARRPDRREPQLVRPAASALTASPAAFGLRPLQAPSGSSTTPGAPAPLEPAAAGPTGAAPALEAAAAAGAPAALAGAVLVAFVLLIQAFRGLAQTPRPPLLASGLQRPG